MSTDLDPQTAGAVVVPPQPVAIITLLQLRAMIHEYIVDSRTGDGTLSYRETAELPLYEVVNSSANHLWAKFEKAGLLAENGEAIEGTVKQITYTAGDDLVYGQVCVIDADGMVQPYKTEPEFVNTVKEAIGLQFIEGDVPDVQVHKVTDELLKAVGVNTSSPLTADDTSNATVDAAARGDDNDEFF